MKIDLKWDRPIRLREGSRVKLIYFGDLDRVSEKPGIYIFARSFGKRVTPLYVGQALRLRNRIEQQFNNVHLMMGLKQAIAGRRILLIARVILHRGQQRKKVLAVVESALIKRALADGHDLLNLQGTKTKVHAVRSKGNGTSRQVAPLTMYVER